MLDTYRYPSKGFRPGTPGIAVKNNSTTLQRTHKKSFVLGRNKPIRKLFAASSYSILENIVTTNPRLNPVKTLTLTAISPVPYTTS